MSIQEQTLRVASAATLVLGPLLALQGRAVQRNTPRLPAAAGPTVGGVDGPEPALRLLVVGESMVAGVGAATHAEALSG